MRRKKSLKLKMLQRTDTIEEAVAPAPAPVKKKAEKKTEAKEEKKGYWNKKKKD